jgi:hypothetical protein
MRFVFVLLNRRCLFVFEDFGVTQSFGLVCKCAEKVGTNHGNSFLEYFVGVQTICCVILIQHLNQLNQAFLLVVLEVCVLLTVGEVGHLQPADLELGEVNNLPLLVINIYKFAPIQNCEKPTHL